MKFQQLIEFIKIIYFLWQFFCLKIIFNARVYPVGHTPFTSKIHYKENNVLFLHFVTELNIKLQINRNVVYNDRNNLESQGSSLFDLCFKFQ